MEDEKSIWQKKQDELTVGDNVKVALGVTVVCTVAPIVTLFVVGGIGSILQNRKLKKLDKEAKQLAEK